MLKSFYKTLDEIPEGDRQHYKKIADRYVLELDGEHPVQAQVTTITEEKRTELAKVNQRAATAEAEVQTLKTQAASSPTLPSGHVPVPADKAKLLDAIEELGEGADTKAKVESVKTKLTEHADLVTKTAKLERTETLRKIAEAGIDGKKLKLSVLEMLDQNAGGLEYREHDVTVTIDGKTTTQKVPEAKVNGKWISLKEQIEGPWKDLGPSLIEAATPAGTRVVGQVADDKTKGTGNMYDQIRIDAAEKAKAQQITAIPLEQRLHMS